MIDTKALRYLIRARRFPSNKELDRLAGITEGYTSELLNRRRNLPFDAIAKIAFALDVPISAFVPTLPADWRPASWKEPAASRIFNDSLFSAKHLLTLHRGLNVEFLHPDLAVERLSITSVPQSLPTKDMEAARAWFRRSIQMKATILDHSSYQHRIIAREGFFKQITNPDYLYATRVALMDRTSRDSHRITIAVAPDHIFSQIENEIAWMLGVEKWESVKIADTNVMTVGLGPLTMVTCHRPTICNLLEKIEAILQRNLTHTFPTQNRYSYELCRSTNEHALRFLMAHEVSIEEQQYGKHAQP